MHVTHSFLYRSVCRLQTAEEAVNAPVYCMVSLGSIGIEPIGENVNSQWVRAAITGVKQYEQQYGHEQNEQQPERQ
jgi:hypothetical protein